MREHCILTTRDFTLLEAMLDDPFVRDTRLMPLLRRKIATAIVMFREDLPENVASLNSRVTYRIEGGRRNTRLLSDDRMTTSIGMLLPVTTLRGLALLGLAEDQEFVLTNVDGVEERVLLETVHYQPERAMRRKAAASAQATCSERKPVLRMVKGADHSRFEMAAMKGSDDRRQSRLLGRPPAHAPKLAITVQGDRPGGPASCSEALTIHSRNLRRLIT